MKRAPTGARGAQAVPAFHGLTTVMTMMKTIVTMIITRQHIHLRVFFWSSFASAMCFAPSLTWSTDVATCGRESDRHRRRQTTSTPQALTALTRRSCWASFGRKQLRRYYLSWKGIIYK